MRGQVLKIQNYQLYDSNGDIIVTIESNLGDKAKEYARLFSVSAEMADLLKIIIAQQVAEFEETQKSAEEFNRRSSPPGAFYGRDLSHLTLPDWVLVGIDLLDKINDDDFVGETND